jgi:D-sedoheptulose 7-phosphate isomerase
MDEKEIRSYIEDGSSPRRRLNEKQLHSIGKKMAERLMKGRTLFVMGNGGSAEQSQHFVAEVLGRFEKDRKPLSAVSLASNSASLTAIANDYGFEKVFARQIKGLAKEGDIVVGISTSGNSMNVIRGIEEAKKLKCYTVALLGKGGKLQGMADDTITVESSRTAHIQEAHLAIIHILSKIIEDAI